MATRPRIILARHYEDFQPPSNLFQEEDCETLIMDLPGFRKEQIRAQMDDQSRTLLISGERPIANNKWSRFRKEIQVPVNCKANEIQAKFENGVLRLIMPLNVFPNIQRDSESKPIPTPPPLPPPRPSQKPVITEPKPTLPPVIEPKPISSPQFPPSQKPLTESKPVSTLPPPPSQKFVTELKPTSTLPPPPPAEPPRSGRLRPKPAPQHPLSQEIVPELKKFPAPQDPLSHTQTTASNQPVTPKSTLGQILGIKSKSETGQDGTNAPIPKVEKHLDLKTGKLTDGEKQEKGKEIKDTQEVKGEIKENVSLSAEKLAMDWNESKQYIVNMVAAVGVVIALWVYTKYTIKTPW